MLVSNQILRFFKTLNIDQKLPAGVEVLNPYRHDATIKLCRRFYTKYFSDNVSRRLILGINPGRFGGGVTGIAFTDPLRLADSCGIKNEMERKPELSSDYIYRMIAAYGGPELFYKKFYITSVCPLGFMMNGKNLNYYDIPSLQTAVMDFIVASLKKQIAYGLKCDVCFCLGEGENFRFVKKLNEHHQFFGEIIPLAHPRFIMQYRRKKMDEYINDYITKLNSH